MFNEGFIFYFTPFFFKNGDPKPKFCVILKTTENNYIYILTTSKDKLPKHLIGKDYCVSDDDINFSAFSLPPNIEITESGKKFDFTSLCITQNIDSEPIDIMNYKYPNENINYHNWGKMKETIFKDLITCLVNSPDIKHKYRRILQSF